MMKRMMATGLVLVLGGAVACAGSDADETTAPAAAETAAVAPATAGRDLDAYPQPYRTMNLPALPGATVTSTGRQTTSLRDGLAIRLTTPMTVAEARDFYRQALTERGWTESVGRGQQVEGMIDLPLSRLSFTLDQLTYDVTITGTDDGTTVAISLVEH